MDRMTAGQTRPKLEDQEARELIYDALDVNMMVLAGAGAGKTHSLVNRMCEVVRTGRQEVGHIAAITFTRKAAGEMRARFVLHMREALDGATHEEADRLRRAISDIDRCFIGTIHSFCGRLLRERPVEAGLTPDFTEIEGRQEVLMEREAFYGFIQRCYAEEDSRLDELERLALYPSDLFAFFKRRSDYADVPLKPVVAARPDLSDAVRRALESVRAWQEAIPPGVSTRDDAMEMFDRVLGIERSSDLTKQDSQVALLQAVAGRCEVKVTFWKEARPFATELRDHLLPELIEATVEPALRAWREYAYVHVIALIEEAVAHYDQLRTERGTLTFNDLLLKAAHLLRDHPEIRRYFQRRFRTIFVDEFQDTDPVQAELLFYLTGREVTTRDWRQLTPIPGSLFVVGDEKQSIYRFRRADVVTFRAVQKRIEETGGKILHLQTSFRSLGNLCTWINRTFPSIFDGHDRAYQTEYAELLKHRPDGGDEHCVRSLTIAKVHGNSEAEINRQEAVRIASFIQAAIEGRTSFNTGGGDHDLLGRRATPGDFLILARNKRGLRIFARELERRGIPFDISGGGDIGRQPDLRAILDVLEAVLRPDNPVPYFAFLRGPLNGFSDEELYRFRRAGGEFSPDEEIPAGLEPDLRHRYNAAREVLVRARRRFEEMTPAAAISLMIDELGLTAFAAAQEDGATRAGSLIRLQALLAEWGGRGMHIGEMVRELRALIEDGDYDIESMTLEMGRPDVVQLMNVHQAKGLQGRVVFLVDPYRKKTPPEPDLHVARRGDESYISMHIRKKRGDYHYESVAHPTGWADDLEEARRFAAAEEMRLLYVAATRARNLLVVSRYPDGGDGPWRPVDTFLRDVPELEQLPDREEAEPSFQELDVDGMIASLAERWRPSLRPSFSLARPTLEDGPELQEVVRAEIADGRGRDFGSVVHDLLEALVDGRLPDDEDAFVRSECNRIGLADAADDVTRILQEFRSSEIWDEARAAGKEVFTEVPFAYRRAHGSILRGKIDLIYRVDGGWKIVDYKTDGVHETGLGALLEKYRAQLEDYAEAWREITQQPVVECGLWVTAHRTFLSGMQGREETAGSPTGSKSMV